MRMIRDTQYSTKRATIKVRIAISTLSADAIPSNNEIILETQSVERFAQVVGRTRHFHLTAIDLFRLR